MPVLASLDRRNRIPELMDEPGLDPQKHRQALTALARINRLSRSAAILWPEIANLASRLKGQPLRLLDVATGSGDIPRGLLRRAKSSGISLSIDACDISPTAIENATAQAAETGIRFFTHDVLRDPFQGEYDVVICSLFLHHLSENEAITVLRRMQEATHDLVLVNDLERSRLGFGLAWLGCHVLTRSPIVHFDGPASVRSAFTLPEAKALAEVAGLNEVRIGRRWPCRYLLTGRKH